VSFSLKMLRPVKKELENFEGVISEGKETECADEIWEYYEAHTDELEDLDEYARKRGLLKHVV